MEIEDWLTAMEEAANDDVSKDVDKEYKTPEASPRKEGEQTGTPVDPLFVDATFARRTYSTPQSTPGTP